MRRRAFIAAMLGSAAAWPRTAESRRRFRASTSDNPIFLKEQERAADNMRKAGVPE
jgi:hypothetical protein